VTFKFLPTALLALMLCACSTTRLPVRAELPASLRQPCPPIPERPADFRDPERLAWELALVFAYRECAAKHDATVAAVTSR